MRIERETTRKDGRRRVVVILEAGEKMVSVRNDAYYELGYPLEDVVPGRIIDDMSLVTWCPIGQKWEK